MPNLITRYTLHVTRYRNEGFTLIEAMIVLSIVAIISVFTYNSLTTFRQQADVDSAAQGVLGTLRLARSKTVASENASSHGVYFESATYTLFMGRSFSAGASTNEANILPVGVEIFGIAFSTSTPVVIFDRLTGRTSTTGTIGVRPIADATQTRIIKIDASGGTTMFATSVQILNTRLTDSRHLHFNLGWTIQNATVLRLRFSDPPSPDVVRDITMNPPAPRTTFLWEGDTDVYGQNQHIKVDAHSIDTTNTLLSIHRLRNQNNRALIVSIVDGIEKSIVSYTASGTSTVQIYGGSMTVQ